MNTGEEKRVLQLSLENVHFHIMHSFNAKPEGDGTLCFCRQPLPGLQFIKLLRPQRSCPQ